MTVIDEAFMAAYFGQNIHGHVDMLANSQARGELAVTNQLCLIKVQMRSPSIRVVVGAAEIALRGFGLRMKEYSKHSILTAVRG